jgi:hypothetical protein
MSSVMYVMTDESVNMGADKLSPLEQVRNNNSM